MSEALTPLVEPMDYIDAASAFATFAADPQAVFLDSALQGTAQGRYSYIAPEPFRVLTSKDGRIQCDGRVATGDPLAALRALLREHGGFVPAPGLPPFQGGAAGYFGYELAQHLERVPSAGRDELAFPDLAIGFHDVVVAFDHHEKRAWICSSGLPETTAGGRRERAEARLRDVAARIHSAPPPEPPRVPDRPVEIVSNFTRERYEAAVRRVIDYILAGDIFQANLSQRFSAELPQELTPWDLYRRQREINPAPFAAYLKFDDVVVASASPERFLRLAGERVETCPIKGTRPRGRTPEEDRALAAELEGSAKDRAENVMIVDLLRNDLSRVCRDGSVNVPALCELERFATVFHLVSTVTGVLRPGMSALDLLAACFPGGSITGAPKIRAMEIIAELEQARRGPYCGSVAWLGFDGGMDSSIVIRTYALRGRRLAFQAGGGIVADSDPAAEYDETLAKAAALIRGIVGSAPLILVVDNYDSFVHNLARYLRELGYETEVVRNDAIDVAGVVARRPSHVVLSPGPCTPNEAGISVELIRRVGAEIPILGVCLGHQCIGQAYGGRVVRARRPMHGRTSLVRHVGEGVFAGLPNPLQATRYHSLVVSPEGLPETLVATAWSEESEIMALRHRVHPVVGVQFHPEAVLTEHGYDMLRNFLDSTRRER